jgi:hypothetical protein
MPDPTLADLTETLRGRQVDRGASAYPQYSVDLVRTNKFTLCAKSGCEQVQYVLCCRFP